METIKSYSELVAALGKLVVDDIDSSLTFMLEPSLAQDILNHDPLNRPVRRHKVGQYARVIEAGKWSASRSHPMMFLKSLRLADGQHRCLAVVMAGKGIAVRANVVTDTYGVDENSTRTLGDYLTIQVGLDKTTASLASGVTRALTAQKSATDEELVWAFNANATLITECGRKAQEWLADAGSDVVRAQMLATVRARLLHGTTYVKEQVDALLADVANDGVGGVKYANQIVRELTAQRNKLKRPGVAALLKLCTLALDALAKNPDTVVNIAKLRKRAKKEKVAEQQLSLRA